MPWTLKAPTTIGDYWFWPEDGEPMVVRVYQPPNPTMLSADLPHSDDMRKSYEPKNMRGLWHTDPVNAPMVTPTAADALWMSYHREAAIARLTPAQRRAMGVIDG